MTGLAQPVFNVPQAIPFESPASWLCRAALSQGTSPASFLRHFRIQPGRDVDMSLIHQDLSAMRAACDLPVSHLWFAKRVLKRLSKARVPLDEFLLHGPEQRGLRYRYCPHCFREQETPHLRVDWRFNGVRFCMLHQCMLEDVCAVCSSPLRMPFDMAESGPSGEGTAYLRQCQTCGHDLADVQTVDHVDMRFELTSYEASLLRHGVAMMAALYHDRCDIADGGSGARFKVRLRDLWRMQMLPIRVPHLCADLMRERIASPFASDQGGQMPTAAADESAAINDQGTLL